MTDFKIRIASTDDVESIQQLYRQLDRHHADILPQVFQSVDGDIRPDDVIHGWIARDDADYILAEVGGKVVGFLNIQQSSHPKYPMFRPHQFALIENAVVHKSWRGKGIGGELFKAAIEWAQKRRIRHVQTLVWSENKRAKKFYVNRGFQPLTEKLELDLADRETE